MTQREYLEQALKLAKENPDAEIHVCAYAEEVLPPEEAMWTSHKIMRVELGEWGVYDERIYTETDDLRDQMECDLGRDVTYDEALEHMEPAILIRTRAW